VRLFAHPEARLRDVARDRHDLVANEPGPAIAVDGRQRLERAGADDFGFETFWRGEPRGPDQQIDPLDVGCRPQQPFDDDLAEEARASGQEDCFPGQVSLKQWLWDE
jgi:hypothetical protein